MGLRRGLVRGAMVLGSTRIANSLFNAVTLLVLARLLTPHDFGIAAIASAVLYSIVSLTQFSIYQALVQRTDASRDHIDTAWTIALIRSLSIFAFFLLAALPLSHLYGEDEMRSVFVMTGVTGAVMGLYNPHIALAQKQMRFAPMAVYQICKSAGLVVVIVLAFVLKSFWAIILGNLIGALTGSLLSYFVIPYRPRLTLVHFKDLWGFSGWLFLNQLCETINWRFDQLAVSLSVPKAQMGLYAISYSLAIIPSREAVQPLREILFPGLARLSDDGDRLAAATLRAQATIAFIAAPLAIGLALVAQPAVLVMLGEQWAESTVFVQIFSIASAFGIFTSCVSPAAMALASTRYVFLQQFWTLVARVPLVLAGLFTNGLIGAALGGLVAEAFYFAISSHYARKLLAIPISEQLRAHATTFAGLIAMTATVLATSPWVEAMFTIDALRLVTLVVIGGLAYTGTALLFWEFGGRKGGPMSELVEIVTHSLPDRFKAMRPT